MKTVERQIVELSSRVDALEKFLPINLDEARAHLGAAIAMSISSDDQLIVDHLKEAYLHLGGKL
jgi:hypothetical protein